LDIVRRRSQPAWCRCEGILFGQDLTMTFPLSFRAGLVGLALSLAAAADYEFQPLKVDVKNGNGSELAVRLVHKPSGKPVNGAVLFRTRLDMGPDKMETMTAKHEAMPSSEPGVYRFKADLTMAGGWAFRVMAKVPGEKDTVEGVVVFKAKD
jgi:hypothetical protein